jgi:hypothetical protein
MVNQFKTDLGKCDFLFLSQELAEKIKGVPVGFDCMWAAALIFWKKNGKEVYSSIVA